jgi:hypothetical protein
MHDYDRGILIVDAQGGYNNLGTPSSTKTTIGHPALNFVL